VKNELSKEFMGSGIVGCYALDERPCLVNGRSQEGNRSLESPVAGTATKS
jgi:hypothetical protein